jgi:lipoprotein-anchoring transpeptidase ErfK/SrfK
MRKAGFAGFTGACALLLLSGCAPPSNPKASPSPTVSPSPTRTRGTFAPATSLGSFPYYAATAKGASVAVRVEPGGAVSRTLANPQPSGAPLTFLLKGGTGGAWLEVFLPVRPNGSTGWVRATEVRVAGVPYRVDVLRGAHKLRLYDRGVLKREFPVAIGTRETPTPGGTFYLKELLIPTNGGGFYGPYAYGLSGFSNVLKTFGGGEGVIGIHGTNDPSVLGRDVSHGCIRMRNADITYLAKLLPLGTPVRILA